MAAPAAVKERETRGASLRMRDLVRESGVRRETIHFYLSEGLLPPAIKTGRNTALYGEEHLERLRKIRELQDRHFLPLKAIRTILDGEDAGGGEFTPAQRELIRRVGVSFGQMPAARAAAGPCAAVTDGRISLDELREFERIGLVEVEWQGGEPRVRPDDAEILEAWAGMKERGISPERGFEPADARIYVRAIDRMARDEIETFSKHYAGVRDADPARVVEEVLPLIERLIGALHRKAIRRVIDTV